MKTAFACFSRLRSCVQNVDIFKVVQIQQTSRNKTFLGVGAIEKIDEIMKTYKGRGIDKFLVISTKGAYKSCGAWDYVTKAFNKHGIDHVLYNKISPNPNHFECDEAVALGKTIGAKGVLAIGGGSPIDAAKCMCVMMGNEGKTGNDLVDFTFDWSTPENTKNIPPLVAINTTHGTGTEVDMFAVLSNTTTKRKPALAGPSFYPEFSIDDPALMKSLPREQTLFTTIDAMNHVNEAATTTVVSPYSITFARETCDAIAQWLPVALENPENLEARYMLTYAALIAGISFDNSLLHLTHALEHPLSGLKPELAHGNGLAMLVPSIDRIIYGKCERTAQTLADIFCNILPGFKGKKSEADKFGKALENWMKEMGITKKLKSYGYTKKQIPELVKLSQENGLVGIKTLAPCWKNGWNLEEDTKISTQIYEESMDWLK